MLIRSKDKLVSFSFQPEDAVSLNRFSALSDRIQRGLFELIQKAQPEPEAMTAGLQPTADQAASTITPVKSGAPFIAAGYANQD